ncbi:MAG: insulinase family protein [Bacilli bacterium]|nr:insulinase family protein [Bacilli bacterium]
MKYCKINNGIYNVHFITTNKFKTTTISINFREKVKKEDITIRKFLFQMLTSTTLKYNTSRLFEIKLEDLYSLSLSHSNIKFGNYINSYIDIRFLYKKYSDERLLYNSIDLLFEILFNPNVVNNEFESKNFNIVKDKLNLIIKSSKENTQKYTLNKALELMDNMDPISFNMWGYKKDLYNITEKSLYEYYKHVLDTNIIDIFVVGNVNKNEVLRYIESKFKFKNNRAIDVDPFITYKQVPKLKSKSEVMDISQSKLAIICKVLNLSLFERRYVLPIYTSILGAGSTSRLFVNVREKNSLAYSIGAMNNSPNSILMISSGIDEENYDTVVNLIKEEINLKNVKDLEVETARKEILSSIETLLDSPASIINYYYGIEVFNADPINKKVLNYNKVTSKDVEALANKIYISSIYFLKGSKNGKDEN